MRTPAGILDGNFEYFAEGKEVYAFYQGKLLKFNEVPARIEDQFFAKYLTDIDYINKCGKIVTRGLFKEWIRLNFALLNDVPDLNLKTGDFNLEKASNIYGLTSREIEVMKAISTGDPEKWIADRLEIALYTVREHVKNINKKLNLHGKAAITSFYYQNVMQNEA